VHSRERGRIDHVLKHIDRVVLDHADVVQVELTDALEQRADARRVNLDADERPCLATPARSRRWRSPMPKPISNTRGGAAAEAIVEVDWCRRVGEHESRAEFGECPRLPRAHGGLRGPRSCGCWRRVGSVRSRSSVPVVCASSESVVSGRGVHRRSGVFGGRQRGGQRHILHAETPGAPDANWPSRRSRACC